MQRFAAALWWKLQKWKKQFEQKTDSWINCGSSKLSAVWKVFSSLSQFGKLDILTDIGIGRYVDIRCRCNICCCATLMLVFQYSIAKDCESSCQIFWWFLFHAFFFFTCFFGKDPNKFGCPKGEVFNAESLTCKDPEEVPDCACWYDCGEDSRCPETCNADCSCGSQGGAIEES